jgi:3-oxoacyl-[acyl-carrier protein] reductase
VAENVRYELGLPLFEREVLPANNEKKKWGRFIGISSNMVDLAIPGMSHYIATKMGIIGFMRGLANDVAGDGITADAVLPGLTNTLATAPQSEEQRRATWEQQAIKRMEEPEDVTGAVLFLKRRCGVHYWASNRR